MTMSISSLHGESQPGRCAVKQQSNSHVFRNPDREVLRKSYPQKGAILESISITQGTQDEPNDA